MSGARSSVVVAGLGARTVVGMTAATSAAAVRGGITRVTEHPFLFDSMGEALQVASASYLEIDLIGAARFIRLLEPAVSEALALLRSRQDEPLSACVGIPAPRPGRPPDLATVVSREVLGRIAAAGLRPGQCEIFEQGSCAGTLALQAGWDRIRSGRAELVLCGGVDSYLEPATLQWLLGRHRIHGADDNAWGFAPGEAAGFVLLASARVAQRLGLLPVLELTASVSAREACLIYTEAVCIGRGLTSLFRSLREAVQPGCRIDHLVCDMNGEPYRADEFGFATARVGELFRDPSRFETPSTCWGDVGAASGPLFLALADASVRRSYNRGPWLAGFTSAETGERSGFLARALSPSRLHEIR